MRYWHKGIIVVFSIIAFAARIPRIGSAALTNLAEQLVATSTVCVSLSLPCSNELLQTTSTAPQKIAAEQEAATSLALLMWATQLDPSNKHPELHEAEILFYSGKHMEAAGLVNHRQIADQSSALLVPGRYEYYLVRAYKYFERQEWQTASAQFQIALAYAGEYALAADLTNYYTAAANQHGTTGNKSANDQLLVGKYSLLSGDWSRAIQWLKPLVEAKNSGAPSTLSATDRAWAALYLGQAYELGGDKASAINAYTLGWGFSKEVRLNGLRLLNVFPQAANTETLATLASQLALQGPAVPLGRSAAGYTEPFPVALPSGWTLVGYDVDPETLSFGPALELWLWWQAPVSGARLSAGGNWVDLGPYKVQLQAVTNLELNPSFEWGVDASGLPLGWAYRMYSDAADSLYVKTGIRDAVETHVVVADNTARSSSGLMGQEIAVQTNGWYLMGGMMYTQGAPNSNIGRDCSGPGFQAAGPYYSRWPAQAVENEWVQIADFAPAYPNDRPDRCRLLTINFKNSGGLAMWDNLVLARITLPAP